MLTLSFATFRERWRLFVGAVITVALGVAIVQSSLLIVASAGKYGEAIAILGMSLGVSSFLAVFIVSSTFAFTIAQRRRDLALLRLVGGSRGQIRRLLLSEALLLGVVGTVLGIPAGAVVMSAQTSLLTNLGFLPGSFSAAWHGWVLWVSAGIGIGVAQAGVLAASRRASRVRPLEALRETGAAAKVMTGSRWFLGISLLVVGVVLMSVATAVDSPNGAIPLAVNSTVALALALSALSPVVVPLVGRLTAGLAGRTPLGSLARANLRDGVRRSASTAAPLLVLVALAIGLAGTFDTLSAGARRQLADDLHADLVATGPVAPGTPGVAAVSNEYSLSVEATTVTHYGGDTDTETDEVEALAVDPAAYQRVHRLPLVAGSYADLHGATVAAAGGTLGSTVGIRAGGKTLTVRVVAVLPPKLNGGPEYLLPHDLVPSSALGRAQSLVRLRPDADRATVASTLPQPVSTVDAYIARSDHAQDTLNAGVMKAIMGLSSLYAVIALVNAVVIAAGERRREFAVARLTGFSRGQVVGSALLEAAVVAVTGILLGWLAALASLIGVSGISGTLVMPWGITWLTVLGGFLVVGAASVWTSLTATRPAPISLAAAHE
ncbi:MULTISPECIES: FtsX-like permease family protein [unclassified Streptomyces]|uniref:FtsX-like permease family protein n=1 Tax=unclassified Streptomyces TaxID=2593676 RepID=UPI0004BF8763|nr:MULTISPECIES: FtsX-like permease family protein [unclassified Streptomyces]